MVGQSIFYAVLQYIFSQKQMKAQLFEASIVFEEEKEFRLRVEEVEDQPELSGQENIDLEKDCEKSQIGRWNYDEQVLYLQFAKDNAFALENKENRRSSKIFKQMAKVVITRSADQCRSHHQKMEKKHGTVQNILTQCKRSLERLRNKAKRIAKRNTISAPKFLEIKESFQKANFEMKTPMTMEPECSPEHSPEFSPQLLEFNDIDTFLNQERSVHIGVQEAESFSLDFCNYSYDPLF